MGRGEELKAPSNTVVEEERGGGQTPPTETPHTLEARTLTQKLITQFTGYEAAGSEDRAAVLPEVEVHMVMDITTPLPLSPMSDTRVVEYSQWWNNTLPPIQE